MSNQVSISADSDKESIFVYDETGKYSVNNKCGWGAPNLKVSDISNAEILITPPGKSTITINVYPIFPNDLKTGYEILASDLGMSKIISGIWGIEYKTYYTPTEGDAEIFQAKCYFLFDEDVSCCIQSSIAKMDTSNLDNPANVKILDAQRWLMTARESAKNGQMNNAEKIIRHLSLQCDCCL